MFKTQSLYLMSFHDFADYFEGSRMAFLPPVSVSCSTAQDMLFEGVFCNVPHVFETAKGVNKKVTIEKSRLLRVGFVQKGYETFSCLFM